MITSELCCTCCDNIIINFLSETKCSQEDFMRTAHPIFQKENSTSHHLTPHLVYIFLQLYHILQHYVLKIVVSISWTLTFNLYHVPSYKKIGKKPVLLSLVVLLIQLVKYKDQGRFGTLTSSSYHHLDLTAEVERSLVLWASLFFL